MSVIALDIATKCGIAILNDKDIFTYYVEGSPLFQWKHIQTLLTPNTVVIVEDFSYYNYQNPVTTATLNQRIGYLIWRLTEENLRVNRYNVNTVRKFLELKNKKVGEQKRELNTKLKHITSQKLTKDESDAIALILFHTKVTLDDFHFNVKKQKSIRNV